MFDISGTEDVVDQVGGIEIDIPDDPDVLKYFNALIEEQNAAMLGWEDRSQWVSYIRKGGHLHLNGRQAIAYARMRYLDSDFHRMKRQQEVLQRVFNKVKKSNPIQIAKFFRAALSHVTTNMTAEELTQMGLVLLPKLGSQIAQFSIPADGCYWMDQDDIWCIRSNYNKMTPILHQFMFGLPIGEFKTVRLVPYTPIEDTDNGYLPEGVKKGSYAGQYYGANGYAGGEVFDGKTMSSGTSPENFIGEPEQKQSLSPTVIPEPF